MPIKLDTSNCNDDQKEEILEFASDLRKFEIERFWTRSLFFWGFITTALAAYGFAQAQDDRLEFGAALFGALCSLAWSLQNRGSKYWQEAWEQKVEAVEIDVLGTNLFSNKEPLKPDGGWLAPQRYSPSKLTTALSDIVVLAWLGLIARAASFDIEASFDLVKITILSGALIGLILLFSASRSSD